MSVIDLRPEPGVAAEESTVGVLAHQLLNDLTVMVGAASTLRDHPTIGDAQRDHLLESIERHGYLAARLLKAMAHGGPGDLDVLYTF